MIHRRLLLTVCLVVAVVVWPIVFSRLTTFAIPKILERKFDVEVLGALLDGDSSLLSPDVNVTIETRNGTRMNLDRLNWKTFFSPDQLFLRSVNGLRPVCWDGGVGIQHEANLIAGPRAPFAELGIKSIGEAISMASMIVSELESWPQGRPRDLILPAEGERVSCWVVPEWAS